MRFLGRFVSLLVVVVASLTFPSDAQVIQVGGLDGRLNIGTRMSIAESVDPATTLEDITRTNSTITFHPNTDPAFFSAGSKGDVWVKTELVNASQQDLHSNLVIRFPFLEVVDAYLVDAQGRVTSGQSGAGVARSGSALPAPFPTFEIDIPAGQSQMLYMRARSGTMVSLPIWLHTSADFQYWSQWNTAMFALIVGLLCTITAYAWSVARKSPDTTYHHYVWFCVAAVFYIIFSTGFGKAFLWPQANYSTMSLVIAVQGAITAFASLFIATFLDVRNRFPAFSKIIKICVGVSVLCILNTFLPNTLARIVFTICSGIVPVVILAGVWVLYRRRVYGAGAVLIAWSPLIIATLWLYLRLFNVTPYLGINVYIAPMGLCLTVLQFSWVISDRVKNLELKASTDALTGLPNRRQLDTAMAGFNRRSEPPCAAVLAIDLDGFKGINDTYGHEAGDAVLQVIAERLNKLGLGRAKAYRTGGDEFIVLYAEQDGRADIQAFAGQCISRINRPIPFGEGELQVGASVGVAFVKNDEEFKTGIHRADAALYLAKREGKGVVRLFEERKAPVGTESFRPTIVSA